MKVKQGLIMTPMGEEYVAVAAGDAGTDFHGMIRMNATAAKITEWLREERTEAELLTLLKEHFDVEDERAQQAVSYVLTILKDNHLLV